MKSAFEEELRALINRKSVENESDTPDFILAEYLTACLVAFNHAVKTRSSWYGQPGLNEIVNAVPITKEK